MSSKTETEKSKPKTKVEKGFIALLVSTIIFGFFISFLWNLMSWHLYGYSDLNHRLTTELVESATDLSTRNMWLSAYNFNLIDKVNANIVETENQVNKTISERTKGFLPTNNPNNLVVGMLSQIQTPWHQFWHLVYISFLLFFWKIEGIFCSILLFIMVSLLGMVDGLVTRYVRTAEGGRESTFVFHRVSKMTMQISALLFFFYLVMPTLFNPMLVVILLSLLFYAFFCLSTSQLKKYL